MRAFASAAGSWMLVQRAGFALVGGVILGQLSRVLFETLERAAFLTSGRPAVLGILGLIVALVWCGVIVWARLRIGSDLNAWARSWFARFAVDDTIPRRYVIDDRGSLLAAAVCAVIDLVLLLLMQSTVREPLLLVTSAYTTPALADAVFVALIVVVALLVLAHMYRTSKPVAAYLAWSIMDRLVPTAGFLAGPTPAPAAPGKTVSQPALSQPAHSSQPPDISDEETVRAPSANLEPTVVADKPPAAPGLADELTVRAPVADPEQTAVSERRRVAEKQPDPKGDPG